MSAGEHAQTVAQAAQAGSAQEEIGRKWLDEAVKSTCPPDVAEAERVKQCLETYVLFVLRSWVVHPVQSDSVNAEDVRANIAGWTKEIDKKLCAQLNEVIHHPDFQRLEGTWRGLHYLVHQTEPGDPVKMKVLNIGKRNLFKDLERAVEFDQSALFKKVYEEEYGTLGGQPYGMLVGDYLWTNHPEEITLLKMISCVAAFALVPFVASAAPKFLNLRHWGDLKPGFDPDWFLNASAVSAYRTLCTSVDSRFVFLILPQVLVRERYTATHPDTHRFQFEEVSHSDRGNDGLYCNGVYALAACYARRFCDTGWFGAADNDYGDSPEEQAEPGAENAAASRANGRGADQAGRLFGRPEYAIDAALESRLRDVGLHGIQARAGTAPISFDNVRPIRWWNKENTGKADPPEDEIAPELSALLCVARFAHHINSLVRDRRPTIDVPARVAEIQAWLNGYVQPGACEAERPVSKPLAAASVAGWRHNREGLLKLSMSITPTVGFTPPYPVIRMDFWCSSLNGKDCLNQSYALAEIREVTELRTQPSIAVLADLSGHPKESLRPLPHRKFISIDPNDFNDFMWRAAPRLAIMVDNRLTDDNGRVAVELNFQHLDDFKPVKVASQIEPLKHLLEDRQRLVDLAFYMNLSKTRSAWFNGFTRAAQCLEGLASKMEAWEAVVAEGPDAPIDPNLLLAEIKACELLSAELKDWDSLQGESLVSWLCERLLALAGWMRYRPGIASNSGMMSIESALAEIDALVSRQLGLVFRHPAFRALESTWRGLDWLVHRMPEEKGPFIRVLNVGKHELAKCMETDGSGAFSGGLEALNSGLLLDAIAEAGICLVCDLPFSHDASDGRLLEGLSALAKAAGRPRVAGVPPAFFGLESWEQFDERTDLQERLPGQDYSPWHCVQQGPGASHLILSLPGFPVRDSYGGRQNTGSRFNFTERPGDLPSERWLWVNSVYAVAYQLAQIYRAGGSVRARAGAIPLTFPDAEALLGPFASRFSVAAPHLRQAGLVPLAPGEPGPGSHNPGGDGR